MKYNKKNNVSFWLIFIEKKYLNSRMPQGILFDVVTPLMQFMSDLLFIMTNGFIYNNNSYFMGGVYLNNFCSFFL